MEKLELRRQLFHLLFGILLVALLHMGIMTPFLLIGLLMLGIILSLLSLSFRLPLITWFLESFDRKSPIPGQGALTYVIGCIIALYLFPKNIALASILVLAVGDSVSVMVGQSFGKKKSPFNARFIEGTIAAIIAATIAASVFVGIWIAFAASFISLLLEALELKVMGKRLDDNIWLPVVAGAVMMILF